MAEQEEVKTEEQPTVDPKMEALEAQFKKLNDSEDCKSLLKKNLTKEVFEKLKSKKTSLGGTLGDCIKSGVENLESGVGLYACDSEAYTTFPDLFDGVIKDYHSLPAKKPIKHPAFDFGEAKANFENLDPEAKHIVSTRIRVGRSHKGFSFPPCLTKEKRTEMETKSKEALEGLEGDLKGIYHSLETMTPDTQKQLVDDHFLFNDHDRFLRAADGYNDWPSSRGIFFNEAKNCLVWVNEEDHLRLISMEKGGDIGEVYKRLVKLVSTLEKKLEFARDDKLGFVTFCPTNLGTTLRASVHIKVPLLAAQKKLDELCSKLNLQARGIHGEHSGSGEGGVYDISNKRRLGLSEIQAVTEMYNGIKEVLKQEKELAWEPENLEDAFNHVSKGKNCTSIMKKYLTKQVVDKYKDTKTEKNATLLDCVYSGVKNLDSGVGIYAADPESYTTFADIFDNVIRDYHKFKASEPIAHPEPNFGDLENLGFEDLDPEKEMIVSTRIRVARTHKEFPFPPVSTKEDRENMEKISKEALNGLEGELKGKYYPLDNMKPETEQQLISDHFLFKSDDRFLETAGGYKDWPTGRGIYHNDDKSFLVWVNEEDHLRIISMQMGGDIAAVYKRLCNGINELEKKLSYARDEKFGFLTFCPTNLGTTMRASVHIKVPKLAANASNFKKLCDKYHLQARGIHGEHTESVGGVYDISNKRRLGLSEIDALTEMVTGIKAVMQAEKDLASGKKPDSSKSCTLL